MTRIGLVVSVACASCAVAVGSVPSRAWAQQRSTEAETAAGAAPRDHVLPDGREAREQRYTGGPVPEGAHLETRANPYLVAVGATVFLLAYVPWAIDGVVTSAAPPSNASSYDYTNVYRAIPVAGPIITGFAFDARQRTECDRYRALPTSSDPTMATPQPNPPWCTDLNSGMRNSMGQPLAPNWTPRLSSAGEWIFQISLTTLQVAGIATFVWGLLADRVVVYPEGGAVTAARGARGGRRAARPAAPRGVRWMVSPGAAGADAGLTLSGLYF